jgi:hypothetical protein
MAEIIEIRSFKSGKKYRYYIKNIQSLAIQLASPATSMALPLAGDASNILTKAEGNTLRVTISWVIHDETTNVVEANNLNDEGATVGGGTTPFGFGSDTGVVLADNQVKFLLNNQKEINPSQSGIQSTYIEDKYQIVIGNIGFSRVGLIESVEVNKSGDTPITWNASLNFVAGAVVAASPEGS